ncbi:MAG: DUF962 domain-containing protein, partial [Candidatus Omnitrophica bacterium]|nr:DUF962 domain-containing protein [Candidatus Omnitrophota bacterium]
MWKVVEKGLGLLRDFGIRHKNPVDRVLHIVGFLQTSFGWFQLFKGEWRWGIFNIFFGFFLQWIGHKFFEKNEMGELVLLKSLFTRKKDRI